MTDRASHYDRWYDTATGKFCLEKECALLKPWIECGIVIEVGCGTGRFTSALAEHADTAVGVDIDREMLSLARRRNPQLAWVRADGRLLPFRDASFDIAVANTFLSSCRNPRLALAEMVRLLTTDGRLLIGELNPFSPWQLWRGVKRAVGLSRFPHSKFLLPASVKAALLGKGCRIVAEKTAIFYPFLRWEERLNSWLGQAARLFAAYYLIVAECRKEAELL